MFYPIQIAQCPGFGFVGGPEFSTNLQTLQSGREKRNADWSLCRHKYTAPFNNIPNAAFLAIKDVFLVMRGRNNSFLLRDAGDYRAKNAAFGTGDGVTVAFQLSKISNFGGGATYTRKIVRTDLSVPLTIYVAGVAQPGLAPAPDTGIVTFPEAPADGAALTWTGQFFVQVRFYIDYLPFTLDNRTAQSYVTNGSVDLIEVTDE